MRWWWCLALMGCGGDNKDDDPQEHSGVLTTSSDTETTPSDGDDDDDPVTLVHDTTCVRLFGGSDRVRATKVDLPTGGEPRTVQAWVRTSTTTGDQVAVSHGLAAPELGFYLGTSDGYAMASSGGLPLVDDDHFIADGRWHHLLATFDSDQVWLWVDGVRGRGGELVSNTADGEAVAGATPTGQSLPWVGWLDDVKIYRRVRPDAEIRDDMDGDALALALWWDFERDGEGAGLTVPDRSDAGADGVTAGTEDTPTFGPCP